MYVSQQNVILNADHFIQTLSQSGTDWKLGILSTDRAEQPYLGFSPNDNFDSHVSDQVSRFSTAVGKLGQDGDAFERPFDSILHALKQYRNFNRPGASLSIVIVTDAEEQSATSVADFMAILHFFVDQKIYFYHVLANAESGCTTDEGLWNYVGGRYEAALKLADGGALYSICSPDFASVLTSISSKIGSQP
jgi:hypothetical protein